MMHFFSCPAADSLFSAQENGFIKSKRQSFVSEE